MIFFGHKKVAAGHRFAFFLQFDQPLKVWRDSKDRLCIQLADKSDAADQSCRADFAPHKNVLHRRKVANERTVLLALYVSEAGALGGLACGG